MSKVRLSLILIIFICANSIYAQKEKWVPFNWLGDSIGDKYFENLAMTVPVTIDKLPYKFQMQFDLGAVTTVIYGNTIKPYLAKHPSLNAKLDTTLVFLIEGKRNFMFKNISLKLGKQKFENINIGHFANFGTNIHPDSIKTNTIKHIGTIAPDLLENKILIIDYPNKRLRITKKIPKEYQDVSFVDLIVNDGRIFLPFKINEKQEDLLFDTGSSIFSLLTTEEKANNIAQQAISDSLKIPSWGQQITLYGKKVIAPIELGNKKLEDITVFYDKEKMMDGFLKEENIWGITGNSFFLNNTIIIDYKNKKFGIK